MCMHYAKSRGNFCLFILRREYYEAHFIITYGCSGHNQQQFWGAKKKEEVYWNIFIQRSGAFQDFS